MLVSCEWILSATSSSIHIASDISSFISSSGASRYRQFGGHPEMTVSYRLITSAEGATCISLVSANVQSLGGSGYWQSL
ncbi:predicted protein [Lichtheimia corymbifera JMRC:FSU:9682]|uniref:Uncharacterized protein n=1 Tax=Lichtheimia corymbifera JMRC:FSU:9682 TaxID=1263082 RepID=A0A068SDR1_9FUNG|nr:predicted protein [Lichtheimia corymbifera JMRC:FSU:9682]